MPDKVIVSNRRALVTKYKEEGVTQILAAIDALIAADSKRGIDTEFVALDDAATMTALGGAPVLFAEDERANKAAIDAVYHARTPDYLMILGAIAAAGVWWWRVRG